jgi:flagellar assembly protein FliH
MSDIDLSEADATGAAETDTFAYPTLEPDGALVVAGATPVERAAEIVQQAHAEARGIHADAEARGRAEGEAAGLAEARARLVDVEAALRETVADLAAANEQIACRAEERAVELALALTTKILGVSLETDPALVLEIVRGTLRRMADRDGIVVEVNPADHELVAAAMGEIVEELGGVHRFEVMAERRVERGGCIVRTVEGEVDAQISIQLEEAGEILRRTVQPDSGDA